jgi:hypothetical protein
LGNLSLQENIALTFERGMAALVKHPSGHLQDGEEYPHPHPTFEFFRGIGEVVMVLLAARLSLAALKEHQYA